MNKVENFDQLVQNLNAWVDKEFLPTRSKAWLFYNSAKIHWMGAFIDSIENYVVNEVDDEIIQAENNVVLRWFNDGNDLFALADLVYMDHDFGYDDHYGVNSYETLWAFAVEVLQGYYKNKEVE